MRLSIRPRANRTATSLSPGPDTAPDYLGVTLDEFCSLVREDAGRITSGNLTNDCQSRSYPLKALQPVPMLLHMISPVTGTRANNVQQASQPARLAQPQPPIQKSGTLSHDTVTLKSAGDVDGK